MDAGNISTMLSKKTYQYLHIHNVCRLHNQYASHDPVNYSIYDCL
jgi:hypothetical protein